MQGQPLRPGSAPADAPGALLRWDLEPWNVDHVAATLALHLGVIELEVRQWVGACQGIICRHQPTSRLQSASAALAEHGVRTFVAPMSELVALPKATRAGARVTWDQHGIQRGEGQHATSIPWHSVAAINVGYLIAESVSLRPLRRHGRGKSSAEMYGVEGVSQVELSTQGSAPVWLCSQAETYRLDPPPADRVVNPIACGDGMAAAIAWGVREGREMVEAVQLGIAAAAENLAQLLPCRLDPANVRRRQREVRVEQL